jgi:hypothetical protein
MTQVWMLRNSDTDIHVFNRYDHLLPSVKITYSRCINVQIEQISHTSREVIYRIRGKRELEHTEADFEELCIFFCLPVWTEPCHL